MAEIHTHIPGKREKSHVMMGGEETEEEETERKKNLANSGSEQMGIRLSLIHSLSQ